ncbi:hypothetical protein SPBR_01653 [Sporothrix brasiliensis 5110]|uniref:Major facilitator superfamily (MFS) profile domain-containing protein n=1 Tax=Sporothrix brasiliensis 5110 TaxID=1398154 RepID=A0A0C2IYS0_9PEZI|nr:uncharacterized protein SPBR_01653 [Sporothrix brasiliensis 5110]KIH91860.1 hypothetical protein SPBR_01653 [Sporothrix brasiliensis 5110]
MDSNEDPMASSSSDSEIKETRQWSRDDRHEMVDEEKADDTADAPSYGDEDKPQEPAATRPVQGALAAAAANAGDAPQAAQVAPIPDGGVRAWLQVLGCWVVMVETFGIVNTFGVYETFYQTDLLVGKNGGSATDIAWIGSLQVALLLIGGVVAGPLYDAGYFIYLIATGLFLIVFGLFMTSLCTAYWQIILAQGLVVGLGMGLTFTPANAILSQYFLKKRALAIGISSSGSPLAGIVFPILFSRVQPQLGHAWATRIIAFILLGLAIVPIVFMRPRIAASHGRRALIDTSAFKELPFMAMVIGNCLVFMCVFVPFFYIQLFGERRGIFNESFSPFYLVTVLNVGSVFGRILPNVIALRYGSLNLILVCMVVSAILLFGWMGIVAVSAGASAVNGAGSAHLAGTIVFAMLYGLFSGGIVSLIASVIIGLTKDMSRLGTRMGMSFFATGIACLIGPPIAGSILGDGFSDTQWMGMVGFAAAGVTLGTAFFFVSRYGVWREDKRAVA